MLGSSGQGKSTSGPGVSYTLASSGSEARILKLILSVDELVRLMRWDPGSLKGFPGGQAAAWHTSCLAHELWEELRNQIYPFLTSAGVPNVCKRLSLRVNRILLRGQ